MPFKGKLQLSSEMQNRNRNKMVFKDSDPLDPREPGLGQAEGKGLARLDPAPAPHSAGCDNWIGSATLNRVGPRETP